MALKSTIEITGDGRGGVKELISAFNCANVTLKRLRRGRWELKIDTGLHHVTVHINDRRAYVSEGERVRILTGAYDGTVSGDPGTGVSPRESTGADGGGGQVSSESVLSEQIREPSRSLESLPKTPF